MGPIVDAFCSSGALIGVTTPLAAQSCVRSELVSDVAKCSLIY